MVSQYVMMFDNHVNVKEKTNACSYMLTQHTLNPGEKLAGINPPLGVTYVANATGVANATMTVIYEMRNQSSNTGQNIEKTLSKSFSFTIYDTNSNTTIQNYTEHSVKNLTITPLKQFKSGIAAKNVSCNQDLQLIFKAESGSPVCMKPETSKILVERGWAKNN